MVASILLYKAPGPARSTSIFLALAPTRDISPRGARSRASSFPRKPVARRGPFSYSGHRSDDFDHEPSRLDPENRQRDDARAEDPSMDLVSRLLIIQQLRIRSTKEIQPNLFSLSRLGSGRTIEPVGWKNNENDPSLLASLTLSLNQSSPITRRNFGGCLTPFAQVPTRMRASRTLRGKNFVNVIIQRPFFVLYYLRRKLCMHCEEKWVREFRAFWYSTSECLQ